MPQPLSYALPAPPFNRGLHILAWLTAIATFPLVFIGGMVTSTHSGMAVPDWPTSFGHNMFALPLSDWFGQLGVALEHSHRLVGSAVGLLAVAMSFYAGVSEKRRWVQWLAFGIMAAVIVQGVMGGLRVTYNDRGLAMVHGCFAQAFFCLTVLMVLVTGRGWVAPRPAAPAGIGALARLAIVTVVLVYVQLILGALVRHTGATLAIPDFPLVFGRLVPPTTGAELPFIDNWRITHGFADAQVYSLADIWLQYLHRLGALAATICIGWLVVAILRRHLYTRELARPAVILANLLVAQIIFGALTLVLANSPAGGFREKPASVATAHMAAGALVLVMSFVIAVRSYRLRVTAPVAQLQPA